MSGRYFQVLVILMWKNVITAFLLVFLAELGDKTQLSTMLLASKSKSIWYTFIGAATALVTSSLLGVLAGSVISKYIPIIIYKPVPE